MADTNSQGREAEQYACDYLQHRGLKLIERNFRSRYGEIDLIMQHQKTLVFVEVKYRSSRQFGGAVAAVTPVKQQRILKTALHYLQLRNPKTSDMRFDVVALQGGVDNKYQTEWLQNVIEYQEY